MKAWIDIENPPQVQYLSPFKAAFEAAGHEVVVTARNQGITLDLLRERGIHPRVVGSASGGSRARKIANLGVRATRLSALFRGRRRPDFVVASSRPSDLAAWGLRIPSFQFTDYEYADDRVSRLTGAYLLYPDVIDRDVFLAKGLRADRLVPFPGLKEAISFAGVDIGAIQPHPFPEIGNGSLAKVLFRAPGEATHYFVEESLSFALELLANLAGREDLVVVYVPRYPEQVAYLDRFEWKNEPHVLRHGVPFVSLLKAVDAVISSGGTMLREAAYLGLPAYSILRSEIGQVDRYLESLGRLTILESVGDLAGLLAGPGRLDPLPASPEFVAALGDSIIELAGRAR